MTVRYQHHRKLTTGAPAAGDLLEGEIVLNLPDRKAFSKDVGGSVFQLNPPPMVSRLVTGVVDVADINTNLAGPPFGEPNQWLIEPSGPLQLVLVTSSAGSPVAGFWLWRALGDWERPTGMGATDLLPNGMTAAVLSVGEEPREWFVRGAGLNAFVQDDVSNVITDKKLRSRRVVDILAVSALNTVSSLTRTPSNLSMARLIVGTGLIVPTQCDATRGGFTLGGANNRSVTWNAANAFPLDPSNFPVVYAEYEILE